MYNVGTKHSQQRQVDYTQLPRTMDCWQNNQVNAVTQIVEFVAVEPLIVVVTRLINSLDCVSTCARKSDETLSNFVFRLTSEHIMWALLSPNSKVVEVLAITVLKNANNSDAP